MNWRNGFPEPLTTNGVPFSAGTSALIFRAAYMRHTLGEVAPMYESRYDVCLIERLDRQALVDLTMRGILT
jgi:hypothetical protein